MKTNHTADSLAPSSSNKHDASVIVTFDMQKDQDDDDDVESAASPELSDESASSALPLLPRRWSECSGVESLDDLDSSYANLINSPTRDKKRGSNRKSNGKGGRLLRMKKTGLLLRYWHPKPS